MDRMKSDMGEPPSHGKINSLAASSLSTDPDTVLPNDPAWRPSNPLVSFRHAAEGVSETFVRERNFRFHIVATVLILGAAGLLSFPLIRLLLLVAVIGGVLVAELLNTAIETTIDLVMPERHPLAKRAKDASAGAVLVAAIVAAIVGAALFVPVLKQTVLTLLRDGVSPITLSLIGGGITLISIIAFAWAWRDNTAGKKDAAFSSADLSRKVVIGVALALFLTASASRVRASLVPTYLNAASDKSVSGQSLPALLPSAGVP